MKRRDFFEKSGCGIFGMMMAYFGLTACAPKEEADAASTAVPQAAQEAAPAAAMDRKEMVKKMLMEKMDKTAEEADAMIAEFEEKLPMVKQMCICKNCPSYVSDESGAGFCHPLIGKSTVITEEKGCNCPQCPVYTQMKMENGYYCTRKSELEQKMAAMM